MLRFTRMRQIPAVEDYDSKKPWVGNIQLNPVERAQLVHIVRLFDDSLDEKTILTAPYKTFAQLNGIAEVPLEWWDVVDDAGKPRYQLWIYCVDGAQLFDAGTTHSVAYVSQFAFWGEGYDGTKPGSLADLLAKGQEAAVEAHPECELSQIAFIQS